MIIITTGPHQLNDNKLYTCDGDVYSCNDIIKRQLILHGTVTVQDE